MNPYRTSEGKWFLLAVTPDKLQALANVIGRPDVLTDPRFSDPAKMAANGAQLRQILDDVFAKQPMSYWREVFDKAHIAFGAILEPGEVINDPQLVENGIVVPLEGAGKLTSTVSSPMQIRGVEKVPSRRAPDIGEHNDEILTELGFDQTEVDRLQTSGAVPKTKAPKTAA
jgi:formyl-CoA transferase